MRKILKTVDLISEYTGQIAKWFCLGLIIVLVYETTARYVFNAPTDWAQPMTMMLWGAITLLGLAYVQRHHRHIRVDVFYGKLSLRGKAIVDIVFSLLILFPLLFVLTRVAGTFMVQSVVRHEVMSETLWYPPASPFRTVLFVGFLLFILQSIAEFIRNLNIAIRNKPYD